MGNNLARDIDTVANASTKSPLAAEKAMLVIDLPDETKTTELSTLGIGALEMADCIKIDSGDMNELANQGLSEVHAGMAKVSEIMDPIVDPAYKAYKAALALRNRLLEPFERAKDTYKRKIACWLDHQAKLLRDAERDAQAKRQAAIKAAEAEALKVMETAGVAPEQIMQAVAKAEEAEMAPIFVDAPAAGDMGSNSSRAKWEAQIVSLPEFLRYLANDMESEAPKFDNTIELKLGQLQKFAAATSGSVPIPGVSFTKKRTITARK